MSPDFTLHNFSRFHTAWTHALLVYTFLTVVVGTDIDAGVGIGVGVYL